MWFADSSRMHGKGVISIWFFIGTLLAIYGVLILGAGIADWMAPEKHPVVLADLHAGVWWGALMIVLGIGYVTRFRPGRER
jgi:hypothetical protein